MSISMHRSAEAQSRAKAFKLAQSVPLPLLVAIQKSVKNKFEKQVSRSGYSMCSLKQVAQIPSLGKEVQSLIKQFTGRSKLLWQALGTIWPEIKEMHMDIKVHNSPKFHVGTAGPGMVYITLQTFQDVLRLSPKGRKQALNRLTGILAHELGHNFMRHILQKSIQYLQKPNKYHDNYYPTLDNKSKQLLQDVINKMPTTPLSNHQKEFEADTIGDLLITIAKRSNKNWGTPNIMYDLWTNFFPSLKPENVDLVRKSHPSYRQRQLQAARVTCCLYSAIVTHRTTDVTSPVMREKLLDTIPTKSNL
ncbi:hypothetical protein COB21_04245 [Candidatus Aerophobetes bacterium]|uniref:Peptidase M48 domain-containing protein n=1 Tax=Aerophobetes bacterium TaxID=2030807 RepID=A0A2A4X3C0_UNCAE|nr:MAG: hypothetical protein COB21_04245 [Candidatus Aerophobetes bacterium]